MTDPIYAQRYRTRRRLPAGRAEAAYAGRDAEGHPVVVTVVRPVDPDVFLRTMGVVASVRHLDLAPVVDAGRDGPDCYVVGWDYGEVDAAALVERGPLPVSDAALIGASAAAGLAALHERGVVHGGLDPSSLVRGEDGSVKLTGAGIAEAFPPPDLRAGTPPDVARYLSPEEVAGRAPSPASDVYRLGLVVYLLLTGRHAFDGVDGRAVAQEQLDGVVQPPQLLNPEVPPAVAQIVMRALQKDPARAAARRSSRPTSSASCARRRSCGRRRSRAARPGSGSWPSSSSPWPPSPPRGRWARSAAAGQTRSRSRTSPA